MDEELELLMKAEGVDSAKIAEQITQKTGKVFDKIPDDKKPDDKPPEKKPDEKKPDIKSEVPNPEAIRAAMLNEMFGEQFKTVEDVKKANISASLHELATLRQKNQELETQVKAKPKHAFVNENVAKMNEFIRETKIEDVGVFNKINATDVANMDSMDALVLQHIIENPSLAGKEPQVRRYFETKYNVDSNKVDAGDLTQDELEINLVGVTSDGTKAKAKLMELKSKIKMPEVPAEETPSGKSKWAPEVETQQKAIWETVNSKMGEEFAKIPIRIKGSTEPIVNFSIPEESKKAVLKTALDYAVSNQMEVNEANVKAVANMMYSELILANLDQITHAVFERARSMNEAEALKLYHNPSGKNNDNPDKTGEPESDEAKREKAYRGELER
jgi:hypothetical protein